LAPERAGRDAGNGEDFADFLLGYGNGQVPLSVTRPAAPCNLRSSLRKQTYRGFYFGDTWHATPKLTLTLARVTNSRVHVGTTTDDLLQPAATNASVTGCNGTPGSSCPETFSGWNWREYEPE